MNWLHHLQQELLGLQIPSNEELVTNGLYMPQIFARLCEVIPQIIEIRRVRQLGLSEDAIASEIGTGRKTLAYQIKKAAEILKKNSPNYFKKFFRLLRKQQSRSHLAV